MRTDKPIGTYLVAWPMLWALWIAGEGHPDASIVFIFLAGAFLMRSAGCVINDYADRHIDAKVARTKDRPLATGEVSSKEAIILFFTLVIAAFLLALFLNALTLQLAIIAVLLAILYPFTKRFTHLPQVFLSLAFAWSIPMAFAAVTGDVPGITWLLFLATMLWVVAYDTIYAMVDRQDDLNIGVKSTAILFGKLDRLIIGLLQSTMLITLIITGNILALSYAYYLGLSVAAGLLVYQQLLISSRAEDHCFQAFLNNHYVGAFVFIGFFLDYALRSSL
ncbi:MAG: 4-hydroxybenzoate octaprenyltransferase [Mariprofundaceae bacterium]